MENQHRQITGYRDFDEATVAKINSVKAIANDVGGLFEAIEKEPEVDKRWVSIAKTHLQEGFMALTRSVAKPTSF